MDQKEKQKGQINNIKCENMDITAAREEDLKA